MDDFDQIKLALAQFYLAWGLNGPSLKQLLKLSSGYKSKIAQRALAMNYVLLGNDKLAQNIFSEISMDDINLNMNSKFLFALSKKKLSGGNITNLKNDFDLPENSPLNSFSANTSNEDESP